MTIRHVGGLFPLHRYKTLADAVAAASYDDVIRLHTNLTETVSIDKPLTLDGNGHCLTVSPGRVGLIINQPTIINNLRIEVGSRSNGLVANANTTMEQVVVTIKSPVTSFYPAVWFKSHRHRLVQCILTKVEVQAEATVIGQDTHLYSYYGPAIETADRSEASQFMGPAAFTGGSVFSATFDTVQLTDVQIGKFVQIHDGTLKSVCLDPEPPEQVVSYLLSKRKLKKEPKHGPLAALTGNNYQCLIKGTVTLSDYRTQHEAKDGYGFYCLNAQMKVNQVHRTEPSEVVHHVFKSSISFTDVQDTSYWQDDQSTLQSVRSHIHAKTEQKTAMEKLDELIGLTRVKKQLHTILNTIQVSGNRGYSHHMVFAGNPGTGKTTVAKLVAQALFEIGAIPENKCTFATTDTLIKGYVGQTGENTARILDGALGGVLFIDEAYQLAVKNGENTFNDEALSVIIRYMEDYRDRLVVIAAGYSQEMRQFLASNVGLSRRMQWIEFEDYSPEEMVQIFELQRRQAEDNYGSDINPSTVDQTLLLPLFTKLTELYLSHPDVNGRVTNGGNGGLVRNVYERITQEKSNRYATTHDELTIKQVDIITGFKVEMQQALQKAGINHGISR